MDFASVNRFLSHVTLAQEPVEQIDEVLTISMKEYIGLNIVEVRTRLYYALSKVKDVGPARSIKCPFHQTCDRHSRGKGNLRYLPEGHCVSYKQRRHVEWHLKKMELNARISAVMKKNAGNDKMDIAD